MVTRFKRRKFLLSSSVAAGALSSGVGYDQPIAAQSSDATELGISGASQLIRHGEISPTELTNSYLQRINRFDAQINSYITVMEDEALAQAQQLENELSRGQWRGPLHGIPIALKDNIDTANTLTSAGSGVYATRIPSEDAEVVTRLKKAGAVILGKLNMHEFAYGTTSSTTYYGPVRNPWDLARIPGGSSGGSGAAVAARLCAGALGTDTGGSIRIPAAHCGVVGFKPTHGLSSIRGIVPLSVSLDHVGPLCRSVEDSALLLQALAGYDPRGISSINSVIPDYSKALQQLTNEFSLGVPRNLFYDDLDEEISNAVAEATAVLGDLTASITEVQLPDLPASNPLAAEAYAYHQRLLEDFESSYAPRTLRSVMSGANISTPSYVNSMYQLKLARKAIADVFQQVDLLITPTVSRLPVTIESTLDPRSTATAEMVRNPLPFNLFGIPSISVPCGMSDNGLPIGLQISGPALGEMNVLSLAHAYEQATRWHQLSPALV